MRKWLLYGGKGFLGGQFVCILNELYPNDLIRISDQRIKNTTNLSGVEQELKEWNPTHVIIVLGRTHGPGYSNIDYLEQKGRLAENLADNLFAPLVLAAVAEQYESVQHITYIGTGCIFDAGLACSPESCRSLFREDSVPNFFGSQYSVVKGFVDQLFQIFFQRIRHSKKILQVRIRMPVTGTPHERNLITKLRSFSEIISIPNSMTIIPQLFPILIQLIVKDQTCGTLNLVNPNGIRHDEILNLFSPPFRSTFKVVDLDEHDLKLVQARRTNNVLRTDRLEMLCDKYNLPLLSVREGVKQMVSEFERWLQISSSNPSFSLEYSPTEGCEFIVTGGCGFIGSHLVEFLYDKYPMVRIINVDCLTYCGLEENVPDRIRNDVNRYHLLKIDISDREMLREHVFEVFHRIEIIFHLAAESAVDLSFNNTSHFLKTNVMGTDNLCHLTCTYQKKYAGRMLRFIHMSTDEVYGGKDSCPHTPLDERSPFNPTNPYASSKVAAEAFVRSYEHSFHLPSVIVRSNNVYGTRQYPEKVIPKFILQRFLGKRLTVHGKGESIRDFIHVSDVCSALDCVMRKGVQHQVYNIASKKPLTMLQLAELVVSKVHPKEDHISFMEEDEKHTEAIEFVRDRNFNDERYYLDDSRLRSLGWKCEKTFEQGFQECIDWYIQTLHTNRWKDQNMKFLAAHSHNTCE